MKQRKWMCIGRYCIKHTFRIVEMWRTWTWQVKREMMKRQQKWWCYAMHKHTNWRKAYRNENNNSTKTMFTRVCRKNEIACQQKIFLNANRNESVIITSAAIKNFTTAFKYQPMYAIRTRINKCHTSCNSIHIPPHICTWQSYIFCVS